MNRNNNRQNYRNNNGPPRGNYGIGGDGLLGEGPLGGGPAPPPMMGGGNPMAIRDTQLALAQSLIQQQQQLMNAAAVGADFGPLGGFGNAMPFLGQNPQMNPQMNQQMRNALGAMGPMAGVMHNDRKRVGGQMGRNHDEKRGRRDSYGRGEQNRSHGNHNRSNQDRDRNHSGKDKKKEDYDPAEPTEDDDDKDKSSKLYCHVCSVSVYDEDSLKRHLNGMKHKARMESIANVHSGRANHMNPRMKAEEHLRNIERKGAGARDPDFFCKVCNNELAMPWERHRYSNIHKQRLLQVRKGCGWCKVHDFLNFTEVLEHRETEEHKKNAELYGKKDKEDDASRPQLKDGKEGDATSQPEEEEEEEEEEEDLTIPDYDPENAVGLDYVIPVTGYFCKLCHKFYNKKSARETHCQSTVHYEKFKEITEAKISEREKKREEQRLKKEMEEAEKQAKAEAEAKAAAEAEAEAAAAEAAAEEDEEEDIEGMEGEGDDGEEEAEDVVNGEEDDEAMEAEEEVEDESKVLDGTWGTPDDSTVGVGIEDTSSFIYVPGDEEVEEEVKEERPTAEEQEIADEVTAELSQASIEGDDDLDLSVSEDSLATSTPVVAPAPKRAARGRSTAKRGRGRGKAKN